MSPAAQECRVPTETAGDAPAGRRCPRPARPVTAFGGISPPLECSPGFTRVPTGSCRRRRRRWTSAEQCRPRPASSTGGSRVLTGVAVASSLQPGHPGVPSYSRTPLTRGPLVGLRPPPPRRRRNGPLRFSFGTWAFSPVRARRRRPPSPPVSAVADSRRDVRMRPRPQWGLRTIAMEGNKSNPDSESDRFAGVGAYRFGATGSVVMAAHERWIGSTSSQPTQSTRPQPLATTSKNDSKRTIPSRSSPWAATIAVTPGTR